MTSQATFALQVHNPDVLTCIANLSNDEVFTPPELANQMLDTLETAWAESNGGASIWADPTVTFLDPFTKSGVFLREIVKRLVEGLETQIEDLQARVDHILTKQVFGIGITQLTALLARRSVYCSKYANGKHSVATSFENEDGNIWFERTEHTWVKRKTVPMANPTGPGNYRHEVPGTGRCKFCGAQESAYGRGDVLETHAYAFIHTDNIKARMAELFGADMQFDVIIGNPPYQLSGAAGGSSDASIYQLFVEQARAMEPRFLSMVIPSRWMAGGRGMGEFRAAMLQSRNIVNLTDYPASKEVFPGVDVKGGICYFLMQSNAQTDCFVRTIRGEHVQESKRDLGEFDVFVRDARAVSILKRVQSLKEKVITDQLARDTPFGLATNFSDYVEEGPSTIPVYFTQKGKRGVGQIDRSAVSKNIDLIDRWKVLLPKAGSDGGIKIPDPVLGKSWIAPGPSACTQSFLFIWCDNALEARSIASYVNTKFFRFLVSLRKITQDALHSTYGWVPQQRWDRVWTDEELNAKYGLSAEEIAYIDEQIKPLELNDE